MCLFIGLFLVWLYWFTLDGLFGCWCYCGVDWLVCVLVLVWFMFGWVCVYVCMLDGVAGGLVVLGCSFVWV